MGQIDSLHARGQALEDLYFRDVDEKLLADLRHEDRRQEMIQEMVHATGLHDEEVLGHLLDAGFDASTVAALSLTPLVFVAWADGSVTANERQSVISSALRRGVSENPLAFKLVEQWLQTCPRRELWRTWSEYAEKLHAELPPTTADKVAKRLIDNAVDVAEASGGVLGIGKISAAEQRILDELSQILPQHAG